MNQFEKINKLYGEIQYDQAIDIDCFNFIENSVNQFYNHNDINYDSISNFQNNLYSKIKDSLFQKGLLTHNINSLNIPLNSEWKYIAVNLSGGADSALLTFLLASIIEENKYKCKIDVINYRRCWKTRPWQEDVAINVFKWLKNRFPDIIQNRETNFIPPELEHGVVGNIVNDRSADQIMIASFNDYLSFKNQYNACYNATTKNPSVDFDIEDRMTNRDNVSYNITSLAYIKDKSINWSLEPLRLVEKDWIIQQYKNFDILELLNITRSCEGDHRHSVLLGMDYLWYTYLNDKNIPECGNCFWCIERAWAKQKVNKNE